MIVKPITKPNENVGFSSKDAQNDDAKKRAIANTLVNMDELEIRKLAYKNTVKKSQKNSFLQTFLILPFVATAADTIMTKGPLGAKLARGGKTAALWGLGLGVLALYDVLKKQIVKNSETAKNFVTKNPVVSFLADLGVLIGATYFAMKGATNVGNKLIQKHPEKYLNLLAKRDRAVAWLNKSYVNKKIVRPLNKKMDKFEVKHEKAYNSGIFLLNNAVWIALIGSLVGDSKKSRKKQAEFEQNYLTIKQAQINAAKYLSGQI